MCENCERLQAERDAARAEAAAMRKERDQQAADALEMHRALGSTCTCNNARTCCRCVAMDGKAGRALAERVTKLESVSRAAIAWWKGKRPCAWPTQEQHISNPTVNCCTDYENDLAKAVAAFVGGEPYEDRVTLLEELTIAVRYNQTNVHPNVGRVLSRLAGMEKK